MDVSNRDDAEGMVDRAVQTFGQMDIIVNNAGIMDNLLPIAEMDDDVWERLMKVNLNSVMYGTRKAVRYFMSAAKAASSSTPRRCRACAPDEEAAPTRPRNSPL